MVNTRDMFNNDLSNSDSFGNRSMRQQVAVLEQQVALLVDDNNIRACAYCRQPFPYEDMDALKAHIEQCPFHPIAALRRQVIELTAERDALLGEVNEFRAQKVGG